MQKGVIFFLLLVPKKSESADVEESKIGNEGSDLEESCVVPHSPVPIDKRPIPIKSPKVGYQILDERYNWELTRWKNFTWSGDCYKLIFNILITMFGLYNYGALSH